MMTATKLLRAGILLLAALPAVAEDSIPATDAGNSIHLHRATASDRELLKSSRAEEPGREPAPSFVIKTDNNNFVMTIGGEINPILGWDIGNDLYKQDGAGISFVTSSIPVPSMQGHRSDYFINPLNGHLFLQIVGFAGTPNQISAYLKAGTNGEDSKIVLKRAHMSWRNFTAGLKLTLFQDANACQPPTIDPQGPSGCATTAAYEIGYTSKSYNGFRFAVAIDMPSYYTSQGYYRGKDYPIFDGQQVLNGNVEEMVPDIPAWVGIFMVKDEPSATVRTLPPLCLSRPCGRQTPWCDWMGCDALRQSPTGQARDILLSVCLWTWHRRLHSGHCRQTHLLCSRQCCTRQNENRTHDGRQYRGQHQSHAQTSVQRHVLRGTHMGCVRLLQCASGGPELQICTLRSCQLLLQHHLLSSGGRRISLWSPPDMEYWRC